MSTLVPGPRGVFRLRWSHEPADADDKGVEPLALRDDGSLTMVLARAFGAPHALAAVRRMLAAEVSNIHRLDDEAVLKQLAAHVTSRRIVVARIVAVPLWAVDGEGEELEPSAPAAPRPEPKTWIEIALVDTEGKAVPGELYWITLPDGSVREGRLNGEGRAYFGDLDPGECDVRWPNLDGEAFAAPGEPLQLKKPTRPAREKRAVDEARPARPTWIEIRLVGVDSSPIANEKYRITLPDGAIREGALNDLGFARVDGIDPGTCLVSFPGLDEEAWETI